MPTVKSLIFLSITFIFGLGAVVVLADLAIETDIDNSRQTIRTVTITDNGLDNGAKLIELNSWNKMYISPTWLPSPISYNGNLLGIGADGYIVQVPYGWWWPTTNNTYNSGDTITTYSYYTGIITNNTYNYTSGTTNNYDYSYYYSTGITNNYDYSYYYSTGITNKYKYIDIKNYGTYTYNDTTNIYGGDVNIYNSWDETTNYYSGDTINHYYSCTEVKNYYYTGSTVINISGGDSLWTGTSGFGIRNLNAGNVGIGVVPTSGKLHIKGFAQTELTIQETDINSAANINFITLGTNTRMMWGYSEAFGNRFYIGLNGKSFLNITDQGKVGIWITDPATALQVSGSATILNGKLGIGRDPTLGSSSLQVSGDILVSGIGLVTANAYYYSSDKSLKKDIKAIPNALDKINALNGYFFTWKASQQKSIWVIAQEVEKVFPEIVKTDNDGLKSVEYGNLVAPLIEAIKELSAKVEQQQKEIEALKK